MTLSREETSLVDRGEAFWKRLVLAGPTVKFIKYDVMESHQNRIEFATRALGRLTFVVPAFGRKRS